MDILVISSNPLFRDILTEMLAGYEAICPRAVTVEEAPEAVAASSASVCILDQSMDKDILEKILSASRGFARSRTIMLTLEENGLVILNSRRSALKESGDLIRAILNDCEDHLNN